MKSNTMNAYLSITRRQFIATTAAGAVLSAGNHRASAAPSTAARTKGETDHFWYRLAPLGPYIDSQRDNKAFGFGDGKQEE